MVRLQKWLSIVFDIVTGYTRVRNTVRGIQRRLWRVEDRVDDAHRRIDSLNDRRKL